MLLSYGESGVKRSVMQHFFFVIIVIMIVIVVRVLARGTTPVTHVLRPPLAFYWAVKGDAARPQSFQMKRRAGQYQQEVVFCSLDAGRRLSGRCIALASLLRVKCVWVCGCVCMCATARLRARPPKATEQDTTKHIALTNVCPFINLIYFK